MKRPLLGAHVSVAGGLYKAGEAAEALGAEAIQIFGASPRQWKANLPSKGDVERYKEAVKEAGVQSVYLHAAYLVNLGAEGELFKKSVDNLTKHFKIASILEADGLIFHIGSAKSGDRGQAIERVVKGMKQVLGEVGGRKTKLVMENASGGGGKIGNTVEDLATLFKKVGSQRVGLCMDTAHAFEAGVLQFEDDVKNFFDKWDEVIGLDNLVALHINDSKTAFGSGSDRHENLGEGEIGLRGFKNLAKEKRLAHTAWLLEVPGFDGGGPDKKNLNILKGIFE